jgi:hypothetical protein
MHSKFSVLAGKRKRSVELSENRTTIHGKKEKKRFPGKGIQ